MKDLRRAWQYCKYRFLKWKENRKLQVILILLGILLYQYTAGIRTMTKLTGVSISPFFLPFFFSDYLIAMGLVKIFILLALIVLFCNISSMNAEKYYFIIRTGKKDWIIGDVLYIGLSSLLYALLIFLASIVFFLPRVQMTSGWGKIIGTLAYTDASQQYGELFNIPSRVIEMYQPASAVGITLVLMVLGFFFLGLLIYTLNLITRTIIVGVCCAGALVFMCPLITNMGFPGPYWFSPMTWMSIGSMAPIQSERYPGVLYGILMYLLLSGILLFVLYCYRKKVQIGG